MLDTIINRSPEDLALETVQAVTELGDIQDEPNILQRTLLDSIEQRLREEYPDVMTDETDEFGRDCLLHGAAVGSAVAVDLLDLVAKGVVLTNQTVEQMDPGERLVYALTGLFATAAIVSEVEDDEGDEDDPAETAPPRDKVDIETLFNAIFN